MDFAEQIENAVGLWSRVMSLLWEIKLYCRRTETPPTKFGRMAVNDPRLVGDLARGRRPGRAMEARVKDFIARNER